MREKVKMTSYDQESNAQKARDISIGGKEKEKGKEKERVECRKQKSQCKKNGCNWKDRKSESLCKYEAERSLGKKIVDIKKFLLTKSSNVCLLDRNVFKEISASNPVFGC